MKIIYLLFQLTGMVAFLLSLSGCRHEFEKYTKGIGIYPGNPVEDFSPNLVTGNENYRNLALSKAAWHSSSYDYNLTAQLVTDGIIINKIPDHISLSTNLGPLKKNEREWLFDSRSDTKVRVNGTNISLQIDMIPDAPEIDSMTLTGSVTYGEKKSKKWQFILSGSDDGIKWVNLGKFNGNALPGAESPNPFTGMRLPGGAQRPSTPQPSFAFNFIPPLPERVLKQTFEFIEPVAYKSYRIKMTLPCATGWNFSDWDFYSGSDKIMITPSGKFNSAWMSAGTGEEWVYVDLGSESSFNNIKLYWIARPYRGTIQISDDAIIWIDLIALQDAQKTIDNITLIGDVHCRYVRVLMKGSSPAKKYILSEIEIFGKGGLVPVPKESPKISNSRKSLDGGNWKIQRASEVSATGEAISQPGFAARNWLVATVPGTVLMSYRNAGSLPDPNFGDNQLMISESFFNSNFWYRNEFEIGSNLKGERLFLNFDGINWKADIYLNGQKTGRIDGGFKRGKFDVTDLIKAGQKNTIAVLVYKNDNFGAVKEKTALSTDQNGGILGADNPTYNASAGLDWIPTIRGRNMGIWNNVYLTATGLVTVEDPFVTTDLPLPDTSTADIHIEVRLKNHSTKSVEGLLAGSFGNLKFKEKVILEPSSTKVIKLDPISHPSLHILNPGLWWPKGYGKQNLYDVELTFKTADGLSDRKKFRAGIRELSFDETNRILNIYINGRRFIGRGGNWGFPESNLNYRGREYDIAVAYHADMNFTMIRNWVGQTGDEEFYEACDRYGVMVWQDFWLANPVDGPDPQDPAMFIENADDFVRLIRNHPSIGLYCGRNEGNPPQIIDSILRIMIPKLHPGLHYISNSSMGVVSGGGQYRALPVRDYFLLYSMNRYLSERGMPNVMTYESLKMTLPLSALWPHNNLWGMHDFTLEGAQRSASFIEMVENGFGKVNSAREFTELAQWINYNGYRGMFEGHSGFRQGLLLWMSHPAWPSMVWQTYDYYFEPAGAYFGCKKASEPVHIQWNPVSDDIEVVNYSGGDRRDMTAEARLVNMDGSVQWIRELKLECREDSTAKCFRLTFPESLSKVHFIKLILRENDSIISDNFYWRGTEEGNFKALRTLPDVDLLYSTLVSRSGKEWKMTTTLKNTTEIPALMIRLMVQDTKGERILPVFYSDNYFSLLPGEEKVVTTKLRDEDTRGERPSIQISGFNLR